ncbi:16S rRNA (guanine(966)-N(2))-methyltransferase RsmD [Hydrogenimonas sp.]
MGSKTLTTRIIGGKYRGKKIRLPSKTTTRSSKARLRESLFNTLQFEVVGKNFVEMFGGSGSVGLEAISRGAKHAWFIEMDSDSFEILRRNCADIDASKCDLLHADAFDALFRILRELKDRNEKTFLYIDPPFSVREGYEDIYEKVIDTIARIDPERMEMIVVEHMTAFDFPERIGAFEKTKYRKFGKSALSYYTAK